MSTVFMIALIASQLIPVSCEPGLCEIGWAALKEQGLLVYFKGLPFVLPAIGFVCDADREGLRLRSDGNWGSITSADGVRIVYDTSGSSDADSTLFFVHCWACNRLFWKNQSSSQK
jgi:hypothetical protein